MVGKKVTLIVGVLSATLFAFPVMAQQRYESDNYTIDASVGNTFGGTSNSTNYSLVSSGGEIVIGNGEGGSYKLGQGYVAELEQALQLNVQSAAVHNYYPMDEDTGTRAHDAASENAHGTFAGSPQWTAGKLGTALSFDGTNDYIEADASLAPDTQDTAVAAWIKLDVLNRTHVLVTNSATEFANGWVLQVVGGTNQVSFHANINSTTGTVITSTTVLQTDTWYHVAAVHDGTEDKVSIHINGVKEAEMDYAGGIDYKFAPTRKFMLARRAKAGWETQMLQGSLDHMKVYDMALTDDEIAAEYSAQSAGLASGLALSTITPGISNTAAYDAVIQTDAPGYSLSVSQDQNLTSGANTIPSISGSIASPLTWSEGTTKGLGFTLTGTNATAIDGKWGSGTNYAALPSTATSFYTRTGYTAGSKDLLNLRLRLDVPTTQAAGDYTNTMVTTGTVTP